MDFVLWEQKWLTTEKSVKNKTKQNKKASTGGSGLTSVTAVPRPASVADAFPRALVTKPVVAATVLLTALAVPAL